MKFVKDFTYWEKALGIRGFDTAKEFGKAL